VRLVGGRTWSSLERPHARRRASTALSLEVVHALATRTRTSKIEFEFELLSSVWRPT
jgi:hypothetical protein